MVVVMLVVVVLWVGHWDGIIAGGVGAAGCGVGGGGVGGAAVDAAGLAVLVCVVSGGVAHGAETFCVEGFATAVHERVVGVRVLRWAVRAAAGVRCAV